MALRAEYLPLHEMGDEDLALRFQGGDYDAADVLVGRYRGIARGKARSRYLVGADSDDIEQECLIGVYKAAKDFRPERQVAFRTFAEVCITRQIITAIKTASRKKHQPLNGYVSISSKATGDDSDSSMEELLDGHHVNDPAEAVVSADRVRSLRSAMNKRLSELEVDVLHLYMNGASYNEIGDQLGRHVKAIDNALQRIKKKVEVHMVEASALAAV